MTSTGIARTASELRVVLGQLNRRLRAEHTFPVAHASVLGLLERVGPQTTSTLAAANRVRPQSMAQTVADLQRDGFVKRQPDPSDRRQILIEMTPRGQERLEQERRLREGWLARAIATELSREEQRILVQAVPLLRRLIES